MLFVVLIAAAASCDLLPPPYQGSSSLCESVARPTGISGVDLPMSGLYILTNSEILNVDRSGDELEVSYRVVHESANTGRVIAEAASSIIYANTEYEIKVFDKNLLPVGSYEFDEPVLDFAVREQYVFALSEDALWVIDFRNPLNPQLVKRVQFPADKPGHHILIRENFAYVLDNVVMPVFVHLINILAPTNPTLETLQWEGINPYLADQVVTEDGWYILERSNTIFGMYQAVSITSPKAPLLDLGVIGLPSWSRDSEIAEPDENFYMLEQILLSGNILVGAGPEISDEGYAEGHLIVGSFNIDNLDSSTLTDHICLDDEAGGLQARASEMLQHNSIIYLAGSDGVYLINAENPQQLSLLGVIKTESRVLSLNWMK